MPPEVCPICGAEVPARARVCPGCGACEETGWSEQARYDALDLPDGEIDYDDYVKREFGPPERKPRGISWFWWTVAALLVVAFLLSI